MRACPGRKRAKERGQGMEDLRGGCGLPGECAGNDPSDRTEKADKPFERPSFRAGSGGSTQTKAAEEECGLPCRIIARRERIQIVFPFLGRVCSASISRHSAKAWFGIGLSIGKEFAGRMGGKPKAGCGIAYPRAAGTAALSKARCFRRNAPQRQEGSDRKHALVCSV